MIFPFLRGTSGKNSRGGSGAHSLRLDYALQAATPVIAAAVVATVLKPKASHAVVPEDEDPVAVPKDEKCVDVVLSSGFLSFANHAGFLKAVEANGFEIGGIMGTSAGALSGSLYAAGYTPEQIAYELSRLPPVEYLKLSNQPWEGGVLNMDKVIERYRELLPPTFESLDRDFAVGVLTRDGSYKVVDSGPLPEAVVASAAIPFLFEHVSVPGIGQCMDGGKFDRVGLSGWQERMRNKGKEAKAATLVHLIARSSPFSGNEAVRNSNDVVVVRSPKSGVSLTSLGDFDKHYTSAYERATNGIAQSIKRV